MLPMTVIEQMYIRNRLYFVITVKPDKSFILFIFASGEINVAVCTSVLGERGFNKPISPTNQQRVLSVLIC